MSFVVISSVVALTAVVFVGTGLHSSVEQEQNFQVAQKAWFESLNKTANLVNGLAVFISLQCSADLQEFNLFLDMLNIFFGESCNIK